MAWFWGDRVFRNNKARSQLDVAQLGQEVTKRQLSKWNKIQRKMRLHVPQGTESLEDLFAQAGGRSSSQSPREDPRTFYQEYLSDFERGESGQLGEAIPGSRQPAWVKARNQRALNVRGIIQRSSSRQGLDFDVEQWARESQDPKELFSHIGIPFKASNNPRREDFAAEQASSWFSLQFGTVAREEETDTTETIKSLIGRSAAGPRLHSLFSGRADMLSGKVAAAGDLLANYTAEIDRLYGMLDSPRPGQREAEVRKQINHWYERRQGLYATRSGLKREYNLVTNQLRAMDAGPYEITKYLPDVLPELEGMQRQPKELRSASEIAFQESPLFKENRRRLDTDALFRLHAMGALPEEGDLLGMGADYFHDIRGGSPIMMANTRLVGMQAHIQDVVNTGEWQRDAFGVWQHHPEDTGVAGEIGLRIRPANMVPESQLDKLSFRRIPNTQASNEVLKVFQYGGVEKSQIMQNMRDVQSSKYTPFGVTVPPSNPEVEKAVDAIDRLYSRKIRGAVNAAATRVPEADVPIVMQDLGEAGVAFRNILGSKSDYWQWGQVAPTQVAQELIGSLYQKNSKMAKRFYNTAGGPTGIGGQPLVWTEEPYRAAVHQVLTGEDAMSRAVKRVMEDLFPGFADIDTSGGKALTFERFRRLGREGAENLGLASDVEGRKAQIWANIHDQQVEAQAAKQIELPRSFLNDGTIREVEFGAKIAGSEAQETRDAIQAMALEKHDIKLEITRLQKELTDIAQDKKGKPQLKKRRAAVNERLAKALGRETALEERLNQINPAEAEAVEGLYKEIAPLRMAEYARDKLFKEGLAAGHFEGATRKQFWESQNIFQHGRGVRGVDYARTSQRIREASRGTGAIRENRLSYTASKWRGMEADFAGDLSGPSGMFKTTDPVMARFKSAMGRLLESDSEENPFFARTSALDAYQRLTMNTDSMFEASIPNFEANYLMLTGEERGPVELMMTGVEMLHRPSLGDPNRTVSAAENFVLNDIAATFELPDNIPKEERADILAALQLDETMKGWRNDPNKRHLLIRTPEGGLSEEAISEARHQARLKQGIGQGGFRMKQQFEAMQVQMNEEERAALDDFQAARRAAYEQSAEVMGAEASSVEELLAQQRRDIEETFASMMEFRPSANAEASDEIISFRRFHNPYRAQAEAMTANTVTQDRHSQNQAVAAYFSNWNTKRNQPTPGMKWGRTQGISITDTRYLPIIEGGIGRPDVRMTGDVFSGAIADIDKALRALPVEEGQHSLSWEIVHRVQESMGGRGINLGEDSGLMEHERLLAREALGFDSYGGGVTPDWLHGPLAMGNVVDLPGVGRTYEGKATTEAGTHLSHLFGKYLYQRGLQPEQYEKFGNPDETRDQLVDFFARRTRTLLDSEAVQSVMGEEQLGSLSRVKNTYQGIKNEGYGSAEEIHRMAEGERAAQKAQKLQREFSVQTVREMWNTKTGKIGAGALAAVAAAGVIRSKKLKDHRMEDISGPTNLPGGEFYDPRGNENPYLTGQAPGSNTNSPGMRYVIRATGDFDPDALSGQISDITGTGVNGSIYSTRELPNGDGKEDKIKRAYGG